MEPYQLRLAGFVLQPLWASSGAPWWTAFPSIALCLLACQMAIVSGAEFHPLFDSRLISVLYVGDALAVRPGATLPSIASYLLLLCGPAALGQAYWKRRYERRVAAETAHRRDVARRGDQRSTAQARAHYTHVANEHEAAGRLSEAIAALRQLQVHAWDDRDLAARIAALEERQAAERRH